MRWNANSAPVHNLMDPASKRIRWPRLVKTTYKNTCRSFKMKIKHGSHVHTRGYNGWHRYPHPCPDYDLTDISPTLKSQLSGLRAQFSSLIFPSCQVFQFSSSYIHIFPDAHMLKCTSSRYPTWQNLKFSNP